jgi:methyl-accepting chemotaxis protein
MLLVFSMFVGASYIVRRRITQRLEKLTGALVAVSEGDFEHHVERKSTDLQEVLALTESLRGLKEKLVRADVSNKKWLEDQALQERVVGALSTGLKELSKGNLSHTISEPFGERYEGLCEDFNQSCARLQAMIGSVVHSSENIDSSTQEIGNSANKLAERTESQAASLEQTSTALDELSASVETTATVSRKTNERVTLAKESAKESREVMNGVAGAMAEIKASSGQISQIIGLIDDITFQTNLLALNAGVEAARAGDAGRGFAVVAAEVRELATRAGDASKQISGLISNSSKHVDQGVSLVSQAETSMGNIVDMVDQVSTMIAEISSASTEQSSNLSEVNTALAHLGLMTQQNTTMVRDVSSLGTSMAQNSSEMRQLTQQFSLNKTSPKAVSNLGPAIEPKRFAG